MSEILLDTFTALDWDNAIKIIPEYDHSYEFHLHSLVEKELVQNKKHVLSMIGKALSLKLHHPELVNSPFTKGIFSATWMPEEFSQIELEFYEAILPLTDDNWLKARLADILWLWTKRGRNPDWARLAVDCYTKEDLCADAWLSYQDKHWERAIRLCLQLNDTVRLGIIVDRLERELDIEHDENKFMVLWISKLLEKTGCISQDLNVFFTRLTTLAVKLRDKEDYYASRMFMELAIQISDKFDDKSKWLESQIFFADSYENEGDNRLQRSAMIANSFYEQSIEAYRKIPNKFREEHKIDDHISALRHKITSSGAKMLDELKTISFPMPDVTAIVEGSKLHVSGKVDTHKALLYFCGLNGAGRDMGTMQAEASKSLEASVFKSIISMVHTSRDGRVIGHTPAHDFESKEGKFNSVIKRQLVENYLFNMNFVTGTSILPALRQLLIEHHFSREYLESLCFHSPLVPYGRERNLGLALWLGFENDFSAAIHLLCPQIEHMVRIKLKEAGEHTTTLEHGIEHEIGLSSLTEKGKFTEIFGEMTAFELTTIFTENLGCNFRNEVAHGLLSDNDGQSYYSVYAWWYVLRMICFSLVKSD
ncbi:DUF4209 domain-containing protein [Aliivibrio sp. S4TY2]|uniref:DUF4209 domain-containing protein n=1 Tax=Aliivibrio finisterrensis TaxID=511998 RepID=A0A4Q5KSV0_9GAMM|nr:MULTISPECIES: DUF4209 domain-containing protein [Aliivibrio]MDD9156293.1 DUF4209 domain-containing protein [Aliivibrio sp. S4TY2]MDD9160640.1 DUF4209 domain-containing protein [Aliivibrio sp. S4TY1]MDD9164000.1 DUF4209 domain-containing protein [Aliivibrio sp. S4MY2]MDD9168025.1 DUF4209 domain-containing protein [Aliivibrio sp. S4MY4]MDD9177168.1 DUF4209 domain-containing protein [Aliivibrio sp. A6]